MAILDQTDPLKLKSATTPDGGAAPALPFRVVTIRAFLRADVDGLQDYFEGLSPQTRSDRFMGARWRLSNEEIEQLLAARDRRHFGLLAEVYSGGRSVIIGEAQYAIDRSHSSAELAVSVADPWHRQGIGLVLMKAVQRCAASNGVVELHGETLRSNDGMIALARRAGFDVEPVPTDWHDMRFVKRLRTPTQACPDRYEFALRPLVRHQKATV